MLSSTRSSGKFLFYFHIFIFVGTDAAANTKGGVVPVGEATGIDAAIHT